MGYRNCHICKVGFSDLHMAKTGKVFCSDECMYAYRNTLYKPKDFSKLHAEKNKKIRAMNSVCPGCLHDFSMCPDYAISMIFQVSHVHGRKCPTRKYNEDTYLACLRCNIAQGSKCGHFKEGVFQPAHF